MLPAGPHTLTEARQGAQLRSLPARVPVDELSAGAFHAPGEAPPPRQA